jgi:hypothetical protein
MRKIFDGLPTDVVSAACHRTVRDRLSDVRRGHWSDSDIEEAVRRRVSDRAVPLLSAPPSAVCWRRTTDAVRVATLLALLPCAEGSAAAAASVRSRMDPQTAARLTKVRALLAKAESTPYDAEAEAFSAKAQQLVAEHSLDRIVAEHGGEGVRSSLGVLRLWVEAPYVVPKAMLIDAVAEANRSRCVLVEALGLCTVVGHPDELEAIEVLATSLLVQATGAMVRHGTQLGLRGGSRTRSFRHAFLIAFGTRIGERLSLAADLESADRRGDPRGRAGAAVALLDHDRRVEEEVQALFPGLVRRTTSTSNAAGRAAGRAAADLASLHTRRGVGTW